jgi:hypothetical protein
MIFLKEQFVALLFSLLAFLVSFLAGIAHGAELYSVCLRASVLALIAYGVGWICGMLIKSLFLEALLPPPEKPKEVAAKAVPAAKVAPKKD